jgi:hypothetical protein
MLAGLKNFGLEGVEIEFQAADVGAPARARFGEVCRVFDLLVGSCLLL